MNAMSLDAQAGAELLDQLATFSGRALDALRLNPNGSSWGGGALNATGVICHYTADPDMARVLRWFCDAALASRASAHFVVSTRREPFCVGLDLDLPRVRALPVTVIQCRPLKQVAWHATVANESTYGIEFVNVGELRRAGPNGFTWWRPRDLSKPEWTSAYVPETDLPDATVLAADGRYWVSYPQAQLLTGLALIGALGHHANIDWGQLLGHEQVQGVQTVGAGGHDKRDPGPLFPLGPIRALVAAGTLPPNGPSSQAVWRDGAAATTLMGLCSSGTAETFRSRCAGDLAWTEATPGEVALRVAKGILAQLGYSTSDLSQANMTSVDVRSLKVFQRLMGLPADGRLGPLSHQALRRRYADRVVWTPVVA